MKCFVIRNSIRIFVLYKTGNVTILINKLKSKKMSALEMLNKLANKGYEVKKALTKSLYNGDKKYFLEVAKKYPHAVNLDNLYDTIEMLSACVAHDTEF